MFVWVGRCEFVGGFTPHCFENGYGSFYNFRNVTAVFCLTGRTLICGWSGDNSVFHLPPNVMVHALL